MTQICYFCSMDLQEFLEEGDKLFLPNLSIDLVIIGFEEGHLKCLLLKMGNKWLLPGGYIRRDQSVDEAARTILKDRTNLEDPHLQFLSVFGDSERRPGLGSEWKDFILNSGVKWDEGYWVNDRFVSLTYYALVDINKTHPTVHNFDEAYGWFHFDALPDIWMDHDQILKKARNRLKEDINRELITHNLLPDKFTMPELHKLHQAILEEKLDRSRFQKKMLASGLFERLPKLQKDTPGRNPYLYRLKKQGV
ncbi:NUDIX hydrolase [Lentiprolixibacter aurantiacus]|uniref:NUDIX hydrolase n=1 Tax=Lentiprolixibacter aurantiacus TaxID=2993939 RepID=A0AAE3MJU6_9FLAO|nr:NUDIX domain-containing protein [Lentiprolixibacter aurantiacus]MCX2718788.1 NUDIX hydrolase [Lentiprolixibacter aurantiacus]